MSCVRLHASQCPRQGVPSKGATHSNAHDAPRPACGRTATALEAHAARRVKRGPERRRAALAWALLFQRGGGVSIEKEFVMRTLSRWAIGVILAGAVAGCASQPPPNEELTRARTLIGQAEQTQAQQYAGAELEQARTKLRLADQAVGKEES